MSMIVADADGLIKLGKSGVLPALLSATQVLVPQAVWDEAIEEGKRGMYEDAYILERELTAGGAEIVDLERSEEAEALLAGSAAALGAGESAALGVFFARGADAILTDDRAFFGLLASSEPPVPALVPASAIVSLAEAYRLSLEGAREALHKLEGSVRKSVLAAALEELETLEKESNDERD